MSAIEYTEADLVAAVNRHYPSHSGIPRAQVERRIASEIAARYGLSIDELLGRRQSRPYTAARTELYRALKLEGWSSTQIGAFVGGRDHTTVLNALNGKTRRPK